MFKQELASILHSLFQKRKRKGILSSPCYEARGALISNLDKDGLQRKLSAGVFHELRHSNFQQHISDQIQ